MSALKSATSSLAKIGSLGFFWWALDAFSKVFDYGIYTTVVAYYGIIIGGSIMFAAAFVLDISLLYIYAYFNKDIFGFGVIAEWKEYRGESLWKKLRRSIVNASDPVAYLGISLIANPFLATVYARKGNRSGKKGMDRSDWLLFIPSFLISNVFWVLFSDRIAPVTKAFWEALAKLFTLQA